MKKKIITMVAALALLVACTQQPSSVTTVNTETPSSASTSPTTENEKANGFALTPALKENIPSPSPVDNLRDADIYLDVEDAQALSITYTGDVADSYISRYTPNIEGTTELKGGRVIAISPWQHSGIIVACEDKDGIFKVWGRDADANEMQVLHETALEFPVIESVIGFSTGEYAWVENDGNRWRIMVHLTSGSDVVIDAGAINDDSITIPNIVAHKYSTIEDGFAYLVGLTDRTNEKWFLKVYKPNQSAFSIEMISPSVSERQSVLLSDTQNAVIFMRSQNVFYADVYDLSRIEDNLPITIAIESPAIPISMYFYTPMQMPVTYTPPIVWIDESGSAFAYRTDTKLLYALPVSVKKIVPVRDQIAVVTKDGKHLLICFSNYHESDEGPVTALEVYATRDGETIEEITFCNDGVLRALILSENSEYKVASISIPHYYGLGGE